MSATDQWAVSMPIREVLADPDLAGRASCAVCSGPGRSGLVGVRGRRRDRRAAPRRAPVSAPTAATASASKRWPPPSGRWKPAIPELCTGSFFPFLLHPRRRVDKAPMRRDLLGPESRGGFTRKAWRPGAGPGQRVGHLALDGLKAPRRASTRACTSSSPGRWTAPGSPTSSPGATHLNVRVGRRVVRWALVVATGVSAQGRREIPEHGPGGCRDH